MINGVQYTVKLSVSNIEMAWIQARSMVFIPRYRYFFALFVPLGMAFASANCLFRLGPRQIFRSNNEQAEQTNKADCVIVCAFVFRFFAAANLPADPRCRSRDQYTHRITMFGECVHAHVRPKRGRNETDGWRAHSHAPNARRPPHWWKCFFRRISSSCVTATTVAYHPDRLKHVRCQSKYGFFLVFACYYDFSGMIHPEQIQNVMRQSVSQKIFCVRHHKGKTIVVLSAFPVEKWLKIVCVTPFFPLHPTLATRVRRSLQCILLLLHIYTWYEIAAYAAEWLHFHSTKQIEAQTMKWDESDGEIGS